MKGYTVVKVKYISSPYSHSPLSSEAATNYMNQLFIEGKKLLNHSFPLVLVVFQEESPRVATLAEELVPKESILYHLASVLGLDHYLQILN